jgi:hypothetical protein
LKRTDASLPNSWKAKKTMMPTAAMSMKAPCEFAGLIGVLLQVHYSRSTLQLVLLEDSWPFANKNIHGGCREGVVVVVAVATVALTSSSFSSFITILLHDQVRGMMLHHAAAVYQ